MKWVLFLFACCVLALLDVMYLVLYFSQLIGQKLQQYLDNTLFAAFVIELLRLAIALCVAIAIAKLLIKAHIC